MDQFTSRTLVPLSIGCGKGVVKKIKDYVFSVWGSMETSVDVPIITLPFLESVYRIDHLSKQRGTVFEIRVVENPGLCIVEISIRPAPVTSRVTSQRSLLRETKDSVIEVPNLPLCHAGPESGWSGFRRWLKD